MALPAGGEHSAARPHPSSALPAWIRCGKVGRYAAWRRRARSLSRKSGSDSHWTQRVDDLLVGRPAPAPLHRGVIRAPGIPREARILPATAVHGLGPCVEPAPPGRCVRSQGMSVGAGAFDARRAPVPPGQVPRQVAAVRAGSLKAAWMLLRRPPRKRTALRRRCDSARPQGDESRAPCNRPAGRLGVYRSGTSGRTPRESPTPRTTPELSPPHVGRVIHLHHHVRKVVLA